jgi:hypothetical protein
MEINKADTSNKGNHGCGAEASDKASVEPLLWENFATLGYELHSVRFSSHMGTTELYKLQMNKPELGSTVIHPNSDSSEIFLVSHD